MEASLLLFLKDHHGIWDTLLRGISLLTEPFAYIEATSFFIGDGSYERCEFTNCQGMYWFLIKAILPSKDMKMNLETLSGFFFFSIIMLFPSSVFFFFKWVVNVVLCVCMFCLVQRNWSFLKVLCKTMQQLILVMVRVKCTKGYSTWIVKTWICWFSAMSWRARAKAILVSKLITSSIARWARQLGQFSLEA